jgi:hypothetical protein
VTPIIHLGEVDCGFVIWYRARAYGEDVQAQMTQSICAYFNFVDELIEAGYGTVVITGASMPTIRDGQRFGEVANKRREITASLLERTNLTIAYNLQLAAEAAKRDIPFIDIGQLVRDPRSGVVADEYRNPDPTDHHLHPVMTARLWAEQLTRIELDLGMQASDETFERLA